MPLSNRQTLTQYLIDQRRRFPQATGDFNALVLDVALACKAIAKAVAAGALFFAQIFVVLTTNANRITLPWNDGPTDFTGGPNGITDSDPISILGYEFGSTRSYLWLSLAVFAETLEYCAEAS